MSGRKRKPTPRRPGRPAGTHNRRALWNWLQPSRCPDCGSTARTKYTQRRELPGGFDATGEAYAAAIVRRCRCLVCGQFRDDAERVYPGDPAPQKAPSLTSIDFDN